MTAIRASPGARGRTQSDRRRGGGLGLARAGRRGFPTGIKWRPSPTRRPTQKYIVCNADEGDCGTFADRMIMEGDPFVLIEGMTIAGIAVGATKGYIYSARNIPHAIAAMEIAVAARARRHARRDCSARLGRFDIEVRVGAGAYVCGEETSLLESLEGKRGEVRAKPPLPAIKGLFGKPTVINNVLSLATRADHPRARAAAFYRDSAWAGRAARMPIQLAGNIKRGGLFETAFGITLRELVYDYRRRHAHRPAGPRGAGRRAARRLYPASAVRHAVRLRGVHRARRR